METVLHAACVMHAYAAPPRFIPQALLQWCEMDSICRFRYMEVPWRGIAELCRLSFTTRTSYHTAVYRHAKRARA